MLDGGFFYLVLDICKGRAEEENRFFSMGVSKLQGFVGAFGGNRRQLAPSVSDLVRYRSCLWSLLVMIHCANLCDTHDALK